MLLKNARVLAGSGLVERDVLIEGGRIAKVRPAIVCAGHERIDCSGLVALPGLMDIHAHLREPGQVEKEDFLSGSRAALAGGYTVVWDMPNNMPKPTCTKEALEGKRKLAGRAECEVRFHFGADGRNFNEIRAARPESLKMYLGETTGNLLLQDEGAIEKHMRQFPRQSPVFVHAEGKWIRKAVGIARRLGRKVHITHAPRAADVETAKSWKLGSVDCTPHHLFLHSSDFLEGDWRGNVKPPLQSRKQVERLWGVLDKVDAIGTDHAPHLVKDKEKGAYGFPGLETSLALFLDAYSKGRVGLKWIQERFCENPARIMGMTGYGKLERGFVGDVALVDLNCEWEVRAGDMKSKAKWSPWEGRGLRGRVVKTIFRGKIAYEI